MKTRISLSIMLSLFVLTGLLGCEDNDQGDVLLQDENIPLEYVRCPCEREIEFLAQFTINDIYLFDASKTSKTEMKKFSTVGEESNFVWYLPKENRAVFYSYSTYSNIIYVGIGYFCNFPKIAKKWKIPHEGIKISFTADGYEACNGGFTIGTSFYSDNILVSLIRKAK